MKLLIKAYLRLINWLHQLYILWWQKIKAPVIKRYNFIYCFVWYRFNLIRCRFAIRHRSLRVAFLVTEISKWKGQSVYDYMSKALRYSPFIAIFPSQRDINSGEEDRALLEKRLYFEARGMKVVSIWDGTNRETISPMKMNADIVFYQQPWELTRNTYPTKIARRALTFYFPYYMLNGLDLDLELGCDLHHYVFGYILSNKFVKKFYEKEKKKFSPGYVGKFLALGHPIIDAFNLANDTVDSRNMVIYAPHWTFEYGNHRPHLHYSTFLENGKAVLEFAKQHTEIEWVFKPHPLLRFDLVSSGAMSKDDVDTYYAEWEKLGQACYDAEYIPLFKQSRAMITDCGSFLTEYVCTGNPIIRPINPKLNTPPHPMLAELYATYYNTHSNKELVEVLEKVIINCDDYNRDKRLTKLKETNLLGNYAAKNIGEYLNKLFHVIEKDVGIA